MLSGLDDIEVPLTEPTEGSTDVTTCNSRVCGDRWDPTFVCQAMPYHAMRCHAVPCRAVSCRVMSFLYCCAGLIITILQKKNDS